MTARLLISVRPGESLGALIDEGQLRWFDFVRTLQDGPSPVPVGAVYLGRVRNIEPGLEAAFIDLGTGESALLRSRDAQILAAEGTAKVSIERLVHEGEAVLVQISRSGRDGKGPRVTADLALPSPGGDTVRPGHGGKTPLWTHIQAQAKSAAAPALLWRPPEPHPAVKLWQAAPGAPRMIEVDHDASAAALRRALAESNRSAEVRVSRGDVFRAQGIDEEMDRLSASSTSLPGGGTLIIEPTAALIAIDVNAGPALGSTTEDTALKVNLEAAREIPRQIALRRLGGIIVIDFLRMKAARHRRETIEQLKHSLEKHRINGSMSGFSAASLVEIVVPRTGTPLHERVFSACPSCGGSGFRPDRTSCALALLARIAEEARRGGAPGLEGRAAPEVIDWLETHAAEVARELERFAVTNVSWHAEPDWPPDQMEVRRLQSC